jgi:hypothetical protein
MIAACAAAMAFLRAIVTAVKTLWIALMCVADLLNLTNAGSATVMEFLWGFVTAKVIFSTVMEIVALPHGLVMVFATITSL